MLFISLSFFFLFLFYFLLVFFFILFFLLFYVLEKALFHKTFYFIFYSCFSVLHVNQYSLILLCHFFQKIKIRQNILEKRLRRACFSSFLILAPNTQYLTLLLCQKTKKIKNLLLHTFSTTNFSEKKERILRVKILEISSLNLMKSNSKTKICDIVNF